MGYINRDSRNGRWLARWRDPGGRQHKKSFARKVDAQRWLDQMSAETHRGNYVDPAAGKIRLGTYAIKWADNLAHLKVSTAERYRGVVVVHLVPRWGTWPMGKVARSDVVEWIAELHAQGRAPGTIRQMHRVLSLIFDSAIADGRIGRNPAAKVKLPRQVRAEPVFLSAAQVSALVGAAEPRDALVICVLAFTGLRFGELAALRVKRVDFSRRRLTVAEGVTEVRGVMVWSTPKTHQSRSVPIPPALVPALMDLCAGRDPDEPVFTSPTGGPLRLNNWRARVFDRACRAAKLEGVTPHDLRHTAASLAVSAGANVKAVQRMLGHASAAMTLDVYAGLFGDDLDAVAGLLDRHVPEVLGHKWATSDQVPPSGPGDKEADMGGDLR